MRELLEQVREGFARLDADEIDLFELDELILGYQRRAEALRDLCGVSGTLHASV
ncbi:MAG: hypothetical protein ABSG43_11755 [Solirubrobacteraceae bacterium]